MDWKLTKKYMIIFLLILNIILMIANLTKQKEYKISKLQEESIKIYLEKNDIEISADIPKEFYPVNSISMKKVLHNEDVLQNIFFGDAENVTKTMELGSSIFKKGQKILIINNSYVMFEDNEKEEDFLYEKNYILKKSEEIKKALSKNYGKMELDLIMEEEEYFSVSYIQNINGYKNFNNYLNIKIYKDGKKNIYFNYYEEIEILDEIKRICSPDEAIYIFAKEIKNLFSDEKIEIVKIDLGYYLGNLKQDYEYIFKPYYRFYIKDKEVPFYVNAYTNTFEISTNYLPLE